MEERRRVLGINYAEAHVLEYNYLNSNEMFRKLGCKTRVVKRPVLVQLIVAEGTGSSGVISSTSKIFSPVSS